MIYVLIVYFAAKPYTSTIEVEQFQTRIACETVRDDIQKDKKYGFMSAKCIEVNTMNQRGGR